MGNKLVFPLGTQATGLAAELKVRLVDDSGDVVGDPLTVTEGVGGRGLYRATMTGAAGVYGALLLINVRDSVTNEIIGEETVTSTTTFLWSGAALLYPLSLDDLPENFAALAIDGAGAVTAGNMRGTDGALTDKADFTLSTAGIAAIEAALINEGDGQQLIDAIIQVINADLDVPGLELAAIAEAVRVNLATELGRIDTTISSRLADADYTAPDNAAIASILEDTSTTLPAQIAALPAPLNAAATQAAAAAAIAEYGPAVPSDVQVVVEPTPVTVDGGFTTQNATDLAAAKTAAAAAVQGRQRIDYAASTFTTYDADGNVLTVFDLQDADGNLATSAATAVHRVPRP